MRIIAIWALTLIFMHSCNSPRSSRAVKNENSSESSESALNNGGIPIRSTFGTGNSATGNNNIPSNLRHCRFSEDGNNHFAHSHSLIGDFNICQASDDELEFWVQFKLNGPTGIYCIIAGNQDGGFVNANYNKGCVSPTSSTTVYKISDIDIQNTLATGLDINAVMIIPDRTFNYNIVGPASNVSMFEFAMRALHEMGDAAPAQAFRDASQYSLINLPEI